MSARRWWTGREERTEELDAEIMAHLEMAIRERVERGEDPASARAAALREFGNVGMVKDATSSVWGWERLYGLLRDLRFTLRQMGRNRGYAATVVATLALGIGVNVAMFSVLEGILLRPLPYEHSDRLVDVTLPFKSGPVTYFAGISLPNLNDWRERSHSFEALAYSAGQMGRTIEGSVQSTPGTVNSVSTNLLDILGTKPRLGRSFAPDEYRPGRTNVMILSDRVWREDFGGDPGILGRTAKVWGTSYTVVGVMPPGFSYPMSSGAQVWTPDEITPENANDRKSRGISSIVGRLRPGVSVAQAQAELMGIQSQFAKSAPGSDVAEQVVVLGMHDNLVRGVRGALWTLAGAVLAVWLIATLNVTNLFLTRSVARQQELAIRGALGASGRALAWQFLLEALVLTAAGGALGIGLAVAAIKMLWLSLYRTNLPLLSRVHMSWQVLAMTLGMTLVTAVLVAAAPAWQAMRRPSQRGLQVSGERHGASRSQRRLRDGLVVVELAMTLVLLVSAGLLMRTLYALHHVQLGFRTENIVTGALVFPHADYQNADVNKAMFEPLLDRLRHTPGVTSAAVSSVVPMVGEFLVTGSVNIVGRPADQKADVNLRIASADMPGVLGIRILQGRFFEASDTATTPVVGVVNQAFVKRYFPGENPVGRGLSMGKDGRFSNIRIVGVLDDVKQMRIDAGTEPELYFCNEQIGPNTPFYAVATAFIQLAVRTERDPETMISTIRGELRQVAPSAEINDVRTMHEVIEDSIGSQTLAARLIGIFSGAALLMAMVGLYGLLAYSVKQRAREIGVRIALGARREDVVKMVLSHAGWLLGIGVVAGGALALASGRLLRSFLFGVAAQDGWTIGCVALLLVLCGLLAAYLPSRRAAAVDPMQVLRAE